MIELMARTEQVTTFDGKTIPRSRARRIRNEYYEVGVSCFKIDESDGTSKWYRINTGKVARNFENGQYEKIETLLNKGLVKGVADKTMEMVYFKPDRFANVMLKESYGDMHTSAIPCLNARVAGEAGYLENWSDGFFYNKANLTPTLIGDFTEKRTVSYNRTLSHNADANSRDFLVAVSNYKEYATKIKVDPMAEEIAKLIAPYSIGIEFETSKGYIPPAMLATLGLIPLRDGSITGHEFSTVPLEGSAGIQILRDACRALSERCAIDYKCSFHVHIGGIKRDYITLIALYETCRAVQNSLLKLVAPFKLDPVNRAKLEKDYCHKLPDLKIDYENLFAKGELSMDRAAIEFDKIFFFLSCGVHMDSKWNLNTFKHPAGSQKWNISSRYHIINLVATVFSRSQTVEHRLHHCTLNFTKVINWVMICTAIVSFVDKNAEAIVHHNIKCTLDNIIKGYACGFNYESDKVNPIGQKVAEYLKAYIDAREQTFKTYANLEVWCPPGEIKGDANYKFAHEGFTLDF